MEKQMFCFQCEQTAGCSGCTGKAGVCGKTADTAGLQDELTGALIGLPALAQITKEKKPQTALSSRDFLLQSQTWHLTMNPSVQ